VLPDPFPYIKVSGSPRECGVTYGKAAKNLIHHNIEYYIGIWSRICGMNEKEALSKASMTPTPSGMDSLTKRSRIAEGSGSKLEEILAINTRYELTFSQVKLPPAECTALAVLPDGTNLGHTLLAQNLDYRPGVKEGCVTLEIRAEGKPAVLLHTEAGAVGHKGVNQHGIGITLNALVSDADHFEPHPPILAQCRKVLNSKNMNEAMGAILLTKRSCSSNVIIAQAGGVAVSLETNPLDTSIIVPENGHIAHTNHFIGTRALAVKDTFVKQVPNSVYRLSRTNQALRRWDGRVSIEGIKEMLRDHFGNPHSVCCHTKPDFIPDMQSETVASVIMDLDERSFHITKGRT
jgi:isopenicillin-N N-acyltransferase-like protein